MKNITIRIILAVLLIAALLFVGYILLILSLFSGHSEFYVPLTIISTLLLIIWLIVWATGTVRIKHLLLSLATIIITATAITMGAEYHWDRIDKIPVIDEQGVNLYRYRPFKEDSEIAVLDGPSDLKLEGDIPFIDGATALYPLYAAFAQATFPEGLLDSDSIPENYDPYYSRVMGSTTPEAYERLISGEADLIFCAAPSKEQKEAAEATGKKLIMTPIGKEAFVFFVNHQNTIDGLTTSQIRDIYSGKITNWQELGWKNKFIRPFQRPDGSGSQTMLLNIMGDVPVIEPLRENMIDGMGGIIENASYKNFDNAIGYSFLFFTTGMIKNNEIKLLKIDGIASDKSTITDGSYPFTGDFYTITLGDPTPNVKLLIDWILGEQGQELVERTGYVRTN